MNPLSRFLKFTVGLSRADRLVVRCTTATLRRATGEPQVHFVNRAERSRVTIRDMANRSVIERFGSGCEVTTQLMIKPSVALVDFQVAGPRRKVAAFIYQVQRMSLVTDGLGANLARLDPPRAPDQVQAVLSLDRAPARPAQASARAALTQIDD